MSARWWTLVVWALAAASALFWGLKLFVAAPAAPPHTQLATPGAAAQGDLTRLLGADPVVVAVADAEPAPDARFQLVGVVSPRAAAAAREGLALIAVDGKPPKAFRVGAVVEGQNVLQTVSARSASLGPRGGAAVVALNIAPPSPAATGQLPSAGGMVQGQPGMPGQQAPMGGRPPAMQNGAPNGASNGAPNGGQGAGLSGIGQPGGKRPMPQQLPAQPAPAPAPAQDSDTPAQQSGLPGRGPLTQ